MIKFCKYLVKLLKIKRELGLRGARMFTYNGDLEEPFFFFFVSKFKMKILGN